MKILIDGKSYETTSAVESHKYAQWPQQLRTTGEQVRADRAPFPQVAFNNLSQGLARKRYKAGEASYHFGTCDTIWGFITLPLLVRQAGRGTNVSATDVFKAYVDHEGSIFALLQDNDKAHVAKWDTTNKEWDEVGIVDAAGSVGSYDMVSHIGDGQLYVINDDAGTLHTYDSNDAGATWAANADTGLSGIGPSFIISSGSDLYITTWLAANNLINTFKSTDNGANWTSVCTFYSKEGPKGMVWFKHTDGTEYPFVRTFEGTWVIKAVPQKVYDTTQVGDEAGAEGAAVWNEQLALPNGKDIVRRTAAGVNTQIGPTAKDGFPADYLGYISAVLSARYHLLFAVNGATYQGIYRYDGVGIHPLYVPTTGSLGSITRIHASGSSGIPTVFFSHGANVHKYIEYYQDNPLEQSSAAYESSGIIDFPIFGGDLAEAQGGFYQISIYAEDLVDDGEEVEVYTKHDDGTTFTFRGKLNKTNTSFFLKDNGLQAKTVQLRLKLVRGSTSTNTPIVMYPAMDFQQLLRPLVWYTFTVDCLESDRAYNRKTSLEDIKALRRGSGVFDLQYGDMKSTQLVWADDINTTEDEGLSRAIFTIIEL